MKRYLIASLIIHVLLLINFASGGDSDKSGKENGKGDGQGNELVKVTPPIEVSVYERKYRGDDIPMPSKKLLQHDCKEWYGGVGIESSAFSGEVNKVFEGYPAHNAGLRVGDYLMSINGDQYGEVRGEPGTDIVLDVFRPSTNERLTLEFKRGKVCYER